MSAGPFSNFYENLLAEAVATSARALGVRVVNNETLLCDGVFIVDAGTG